MVEKYIVRPKEAAEKLDEIARESYKVAVEQAFEAQKSGLRLSRRFFENWIETLEDRAELNRRTMQGLSQLVREQRQVFQKLTHESLDAYDAFVESLSSYEHMLESDEGDYGVDEPPDRQGRASEHTVGIGPDQGSREDYLRMLERAGELRRGSGRLPDDFWDLPRPEDPEGLVRSAVQEDRR
jgi:hypothetical protein